LGAEVSEDETLAAWPEARHFAVPRIACRRPEAALQVVERHVTGAPCEHAIALVHERSRRTVVPLPFDDSIAVAPLVLRQIRICDATAMRLTRCDLSPTPCSDRVWGI